MHEEQDENSWNVPFPFVEDSAHDEYKCGKITARNPLSVFSQINTASLK